MKDPFNQDYLYVQRYLHELRTQAEMDRLARQAAPRRPRRMLRSLRLHAAARLIAAGEVLVGRAEEQAVTNAEMCSSRTGWLGVVEPARWEPLRPAQGGQHRG